MTLKIVVAMGGAQREGKRVLRPSRLPPLKKVEDFLLMTRAGRINVELVFWEKKEVAETEPLYLPLLQKYASLCTLITDPTVDTIFSLVTEISRGVPVCFADLGGIFETKSGTQNSFEMLATMGLPPNQENVTFYDYSVERPLELEKCLEYYDAQADQLFRPLYDLGTGDTVPSIFPLKDTLYVHKTMRAILNAAEAISGGRRDYFASRAEAVVITAGRLDAKAFVLAFMERNNLDSVEAWDREILSLSKKRPL